MSTRRTTGEARQGRGARDPGVPRWVKVFAATVIALLLVGVAVMLLSGGEHGPGRHSTAGRPAQVVLR